MTPGINTLLLSTGVLGSFTCSGMTLPIYMGPTALRGIRATGDTLSNVESQVFTPYKFGSTAGDRTHDLLTTRPTCYHSATALLYNLLLFLDMILALMTLRRDELLATLPEDDFWLMDMEDDGTNLTSKEQYLKNIGINIVKRQLLSFANSLAR